MLTIVREKGAGAAATSTTTSAYHTAAYKILLLQKKNHRAAQCKIVYKHKIFRRIRILNKRIQAKEKSEKARRLKQIGKFCTKIIFLYRPYRRISWIRLGRILRLGWIIIWCRDGLAADDLEFDNISRLLIN